MSDSIEEVNETQLNKQKSQPNNTIQPKDSTLQVTNTKQSDLNPETNFNEISKEEGEQFELSLFEKEKGNENIENKRRDNYLSNLEELNHKVERIEYINLSLMQKCTNLTDIDLSSNQIKELHPGTFKQCRILDHIDFSSNQIKELHPETFQQCTNLQGIDLSSNQIKELHPETFQQCKHIKEIFLDSNQIKELHPETFQQCTKLCWIDLSSNQIKELHPETFQQCTQLGGILLSSNQIKELHPGTFQQCTQLVLILLSSNQIKELHPETFQQCKHIKEIFLDSNQIKELHPETFQQCTKLCWIDLSSNQIKELHPETFQQCTQLRGILLSSNQIKELHQDTFQQCRKLTKVNFNSNELKNINIESLINSLHTWYEDAYVSFSNNFIKSLPFFDLDQKIQFDLRNNFKSFDIQSFYSFLCLSKDDLVKDESLFFNFKYFNQFEFYDYMRGEKDKNKIFFCRQLDLTFIKETFFLLYFNKTVYNLEEDKVCEKFKFQFEKFKTFKWSILDLLFCYVENIGLNNLIHLNANIKNELEQNSKSLINLEFKSRSGESVEYLCEFDDVSLFNVFFNYDLCITKREETSNDNSSRIHDYLDFYKSIDFKECFRIVCDKNKNEDIAIKLLQFLKHSIYDLNLNVFGEKLLNENFNIHFLNDVLKRFFELNWCDALEFLLNMIPSDELDSSSIKHFNLDLSDFENKDIKSNKISPLTENDEHKNTNVSCDLSPGLRSIPEKSLYSEGNLENDSKTNTEHILELIVKSKNINEEKQNLLLKHRTTKYLLHKKWSLIPRVFYYSNLVLFSIFLIFYSINIEIYKKEEKNSGLNVTCKCVCFLTLAYFIF
jgi:Leucine-rich repeat (LRR) protein